MQFKIARLVCDTHANRILSVLEAGPCPVGAMATAIGIPSEECLPLVKEMERLRVIVPAEDEGGEPTYLSNLRSMRLSLEDENFSLNIEFRDGTVSELNFGFPDIGEVSEAPYDLLVGASIDGSTRM